MKPRELKSTGQTKEGLELQLINHDGRLSLECEGRQLAATNLGMAARELGRMAVSPFRPAKQPKILFLGIGLGHILDAAREALPQEKASFHVCLESPDLAEWIASAMNPDPMDDERVLVCENSPFDPIPQENAPYQAIFADLDSLEGIAPLKWLPNRVRWLRQLADSIKAGGILAFLRHRRDPDLEKNLRLVGCNPVYDFVPVSEKSKKNRVVYLARKGHYQRSH